MGYHASGTVAITVSEAVATEIVLARDTLPGHDVLGFASSQDFLWDVIAEVCWFEVVEDNHFEDGRRVIHACCSEKWSAGADEALKWLGEHGAGVSGHFVGEDSEAWAYETEPESRVHVVRSLSYAAEEQLAAFTEVKNALSHTDLSSLDVPPELRAALSAVEAAPRTVYA